MSSRLVQASQQNEKVRTREVRRKDEKKEVRMDRQKKKDGVQERELDSPTWDGIGQI